MDRFPCKDCLVINICSSKCEKRRTRSLDNDDFIHICTTNTCPMCTQELSKYVRRISTYLSCNQFICNTCNFNVELTDCSRCSVDNCSVKFQSHK